LFSAQWNEDLIHAHLHDLPAAHRGQPLKIDILVLIEEGLQVAPAQAFQLVPIRRWFDEEGMTAPGIEISRFVCDLREQRLIDPHDHRQARTPEATALVIEEFNRFRLFIAR
jgi:hypothetical protein